MMQAPDLGELFGHVDKALDLLARASGELGSAAGASYAVTGASPLQLFHAAKKLVGQRRARRWLRAAAPHLESIHRLHGEAKTWLAAAPDVGAADDIILDVVSEDWGLIGAYIDAHIHNKIETQLVELNALLDEVGRLHARLRARRAGVAAAAR
jgi:hypothetical protein